MSEQQTQPAPEEKKELAPVSSLFSCFPTREQLNTMDLLAQRYMQAGVIPNGLNTAPKIMVALQIGMDLGLTPIMALNSVYIVNGKPTLFGEAVPYLILRDGHKIEWGVYDDEQGNEHQIQNNAKQAAVRITRKDTGQKMSQLFTMQMAIDRGYTKNPVYKTFPENMLMWRAIGMIAKFICTDSLKGLDIKEIVESEAVQEGGRFYNKQESKRVEEEVKQNTYGTRKPLNDVLDAEPVDDEKEEPIPKPPEEIQATMPLEKTEQGVYECEECGKRCLSEKGLNSHMKSHQ